MRQNARRPDAPVSPLTARGYPPAVEFGLIVGAGIVVLFVVLFLLGRWHPRSGAEVLDWKPTRSYEDEIRLELEDVDQMIEAQNERRRRTGRPEISEEEIRAQVDAAQREQQERASQYRRSDEAD
jgi:hypothetical protein